MSLEVIISSYLVRCNSAIKTILVTLTLTKMAEKRQRVLSIQSHVVSGYVGNKSATFPLQVKIAFQNQYFGEKICLFLCISIDFQAHITITKQVRLCDRV
jgi:hypothetical protein